MQMHPNIGSRADCIARSVALNVNTTTNVDGLVEAVTCDLYNFGKHRHHECVCFPTYGDHTVQELFISDDLQKLRTTTLMFYPPSQVVQSALLAAAIEGPPQHCRTDCSKTAAVLRREPRTLGGFPYCETPAPVSKPKLIPRTTQLAITKTKHHKQTVYTTRYPDVPTKYPNCNAASYTSLKASACELDRCIWNFVRNFTSTTSDWIAFTDEFGTPVRQGWNTTAYLVTTTHWGVFPSHSSSRNMFKSRLASTEPWQSALSASYSQYLTAIGMPPPKNKTSKKAEKQAKKTAPVCKDEVDCWQWCEKDRKSRRVQMLELIGFAAVVSLFAVAGMTWTTFFKGRTKEARWVLFPWGGGRSRPKHVGYTVQAVEDGTERGLASDVAGVDLQVVAEPERAASTGTLRRAAEERRGRPRVRFAPGAASSMADVGVDGADDGIRRVSGRQTREAAYEMSDRGSIRSRIPSSQAK